MARNGSGAYSAPANSVNPAVAATTIDASDFNDLVSDLESALTASIANDGQTTTSAVIPFASGIKSDTIVENSSNTGVTIDGVLLKDGGVTLGAALDSNGHAINESEGSAVASATQPDIWVTDGNTLHITGTTTITDFADAPRIGATRRLIFDAALTLTHGSGITLPGAANITTAAGDIAVVYADAVDAFRVEYHKADGAPVIDTPALTFIASGIADNTATLDFTGFDSALFGSYMFTIEGVVPATDGAGLNLRTSTDGGNNYDDGASDYQYIRHELDTTPADQSAAATASAISLSGDTGSASGESFSAVLYIPNPADAVQTFLNWNGGNIRATPSSLRLISGLGARSALADVDAFRFLFSAGNITSGTVRMYGIRKA